MRVTPEVLLSMYLRGYFPMAEDAQAATLGWYEPVLRAQLPIADLVISRSLLKLLKTDRYRVTVDRDFSAVIEACAAHRPERPSTWINRDIVRLYTALHDIGHAHSVEVWQDGVLAGGLYGVSIGAAFFGESMFSLRPNASKVALVNLAARLWAGGYRLLDSQFANPHMRQFGLYEISPELYHRRLAAATREQAVFTGLDQRDCLSRYLAFRASKVRP